MPKINFLPSGTTINIPPGTELLEAIRKAGLEIESPCGGKGTCGKCIVRIISGKVDSGSLGLLSASAVSRGYVLACKTKILEEAVSIEIPEQSGTEGGQFIDETGDTCRCERELLPEEFTPDSITQKYVLEVSQPQLEDGLSDLDRVSLSLQKHLEKKELHFPLPVIGKTAEAVRLENSKITVTLSGSPGRYDIIDIEPGDHSHRLFGIAIDVGTTTIAVQLVHLPSAKILATRTAYNRQIECGLDIISRINYARKPERFNELRKRVIDTVNQLITQLCQGNEVDSGEIYSAVIAGNTTMIHLMLGLPPEYIRLEPYTPTILKSPNLNAGELGIWIHPLARVYLSPAVGSYVGGDITAGILCTGLAEDTDALNLFIDIGTNGEIVIGNRDFLMTCACSAGPAFEGGGIRQGMRAALGAIEDVQIDPSSGIASYRTIGNVKPKGICGSGMISLLAGLYLTGWLDPAGKLNRNKESSAINIDGRIARYIIAPAEETASGDPITISESDIENIIRAKAAIYSACSLLLEQVGLGFADLANIYIGGGFGRFLDIEKSITIGLLPDIERGKYSYIGNSSLMGAYLVLVSQEFQQQQIKLADRMTYVELNTDPSYMNQYTGALFIPHTDMSRFPSLKNKNEDSF